MAMEAGAVAGLTHMFCGVGLGGNGAKIGLVDPSGQLIDSVYMPITSDDQRTPEFVLPGIASELGKLLDGRQIDRNKIAGMGFAFPGFTLRDGTVVKAPNLPAFDGKNICREMGAHLPGIPISASNDASTYALAEVTYGKGRELGISSAIVYTLGTGVGGGIVIKGEMYDGERGMAGELGHTKVMRGQLKEDCNCGGNGCVEQLCGEAGFQTMYHNGLFAPDAAEHFRGPVGGDISKVTPHWMASQVGAGDEYAIGAWQLYGRYLGWAVSGAILMLDIKTVILGGGIARSFHLFADAVRREVINELPRDVSSGVRVVKGTLSDQQAEILGAAALAASAFEQKQKSNESIPDLG